MKRRLLWKLCWVIVTTVVTLSYVVNIATRQAEESMSLLDAEHRAALTTWGQKAEAIYQRQDAPALEAWLTALQQRENTWAGIVQYNAHQIAGTPLDTEHYLGFNLGRSVDWKIHLYFPNNPVMEIPFQQPGISFLVRLPDHMRPGSYRHTVQFALQILIPTLFMALLSMLLYRHIMGPLKTLDNATKAFAQGDFSIRVSGLLGKRKDELAQLAQTFDSMAQRIGDLIVSQRRLIADLSHELRTPLTRLDIAIDALQRKQHTKTNIQRVVRESQQLRRLVEDTLTLAWLDNEQPQLSREPVEIVDLLEVIINDAHFEFPDRQIDLSCPDSLYHPSSNHRAVGQALENVIRNALRYTPPQQSIRIDARREQQHIVIDVLDAGKGVPQPLLETIFEPFFRVDKSRTESGQNFGLGLALARRQLHILDASIHAQNRPEGGLKMTIILSLPT